MMKNERKRIKGELKSREEEEEEEGRRKKKRKEK